ncbi:MAG TPA: hypothetical protein VKB50_15045 [Vicinamibacterales bacterium]|nr:hypothetical protein [Vicinamibacterales bacterium]
MALYLDVSLRRTARPVTASPRTYIRSEEFDTTLLVAPLLAGLAAAAIVSANPQLYLLLLVADLWLLGYHHVIATYTRLPFDGQSRRRNRFLALDLLLITTAVTLVVAITAGAWVIASTFLYLQWFHYMRQGYGIARMYFRTTPQGQVPDARDWASDLVIYLVPIFAACLGITTAVYFALNQFTVLVLGGGLAVSVGIYMGINFHHYVVDALIWRRRRTMTAA